jgi:hypothetical protein
MVLDIQGTQLHGRVVEVIGRTEPGAALIINGQHVPNIAADGTFRHFTEPLQPGEHTIVIIGQNRRGGTATKRTSVVVPNLNWNAGGASTRGNRFFREHARVLSRLTITKQRMS